MITIQDQISAAIARFPPGYCWHISDLQALTRSMFGLGMPYTYKQVRDGLYRLRRFAGRLFKHFGKGWYGWDIS